MPVERLISCPNQTTEICFHLTCTRENKPQVVEVTQKHSAIIPHDLTYARRFGGDRVVHSMCSQWSAFRVHTGLICA